MAHGSLPIALRRARACIVLVACTLAVAFCGCSDITVHRVRAPDWLDSWRASVVEAGDLSPRTLQTLRQWDLEHVYRRCPAEAFARLQTLAVQYSQPDQLFALAEMSYVLGHEAEKWENPDACAFYYFCAGYAYHYLFPSEEGERGKAKGEREESRDNPATALSPFPFRLSPLNAYDPRFRLACDLYNAGLTKCIRAAQRIGRLDPRRELHLPTPDGRGFTLSVVHHGFAWPPEEFGPLLFCEDFAVAGLANHYKSYGLGVPLIGTHVASASSPKHAFYPRDVNFPITAFFRFDGSSADLPTQHAGRLELYNPLAVQAVDVGGQAIPLETDLTTPLAYFLSRTDLDGIQYEGFLSPDKIQNRTGIYMFEPYQPGKIPVVMVHGLLSSPLTWAPMFNDLRADPELRAHFQFWFYLYPTADPYLVTAADLRQTLGELRAELDPGHQDTALDQMVFVGHSMGGLVSKLLTIDSGNDFWGLVSAQPFDVLKAQPQTRAELQRIFFFERQACVRRVVFLATPHHGSKLSPSPPAQLAARLIRAPKALVQAAHDVAQEDPQFWAALHYDHLPTSVDLLAPGAPTLELLAARPAPQGVHYHSIIGVLAHPNCLLEAFLPGGSDRQGTDGVVPYSSAHLEGVDSEVVVPADHMHVHHHSLAVLEVRRILLEHLRCAAEEHQASLSQSTQPDR